MPDSLCLVAFERRRMTCARKLGLHTHLQVTIMRQLLRGHLGNEKTSNRLWLTTLMSFRVLG